MNIKQISLSLFFLFFLSLAISSCKDKVTDPPQPNEEELITTVELSFTRKSDQSKVVYLFADPDGEGGNAPTRMDTVKLAANTDYELNVRFLDQSGAETVDITEEVREEAEDHLICYQVDGNIAYQIMDEDANGKLLGLQVNVTTKEAGDGHFAISLKHQPGIKTGSCDIGETDVEVTFPMEVE